MHQWNVVIRKAGAGKNIYVSVSTRRPSVWACPTSAQPFSSIITYTTLLSWDHLKGRKYVCNHLPAVTPLCQCIYTSYMFPCIDIVHSAAVKRSLIGAQNWKEFTTNRENTLMLLYRRIIINALDQISQYVNF